MNKTKETFIFGFAIFASFFGAGNLILPPMLGFKSGPDWWLVAIGFIISATVIPLLALFGHAKLQGTMLDFGKKVSPLFSLLFCISLYTIAIVLACPRTAAVTHEMAIEPFFGTSSWLTSSFYFLLVFFFAMNRTNVLQILGKYLTPLIGLIIAAIIVLGTIAPSGEMNLSLFKTPLIDGFLEGYQTYDAIAGLVVGGTVVISLNLKGYSSFKEKKSLIARSGAIAIIGLLFIYAGLIFVGSKFNSNFSESVSNTELLSGLSAITLGNIGASFLSVLVSLACFTTAVSIVVGASDFIKGIFRESKKAYLITVIISCLLGVLVGQFNVKYILDVALPVLMLSYPITIVLIFLNVLPEKFASKLVFRIVVFVTLLVSIPDALKFFIALEQIEPIQQLIPFSTKGLGWVLPSLITFGLTVLYEKLTSSSSV